MKIEELGEFGLIDRLTKPFGHPKNTTTLIGIGDDAALLDQVEGTKTLVSTELLMEGIHFDLVYFPLQYLGFKAVTAAVSDIIAMGGTPQQILVGLGISTRFQVEDVEMLMRGMQDGAELYGVDLIGGDTTSSYTGLTISVTAIGNVASGEQILRGGAKENDLICVTGNIGAAYMGLQLLIREKIAYDDGVPDFQPKFEGREYILQRQMKPIARLDILRQLQSNGIRPTSMIDITDGLASDLLQICKSSGVGAKLFEQRLPMDHETVGMAEEFGLSPTTVAMNGGDDYELLFTVPLGMKDLVDAIEDVRQIGYVTEPSSGVVLVSTGGSETTITAQAFPNSI
ncbi:thiamine-phosphate kinase [Porphyromonadaceae bacterium W3.11]|nr:thiamine-phosphate kinase [Porphyromonadaceae bacterium W3.11]